MPADGQITSARDLAMLARAVKAAQLLERGFANNTLSWLRPSLGTVDNLAPIDASPPNLRDEMCGGKRHKPASDEDEDTVASNTGNAASGETGLTFFAAGLQPPLLKPSVLMAGAPAPSEPIPVYTGPTRTGPALIAAIAADSDKQTVRRAKKTRLAVKKPEADEPKGEAKQAKSDKNSEPKSAGKPNAVRHANAKPEAAEKSATGAEKPAARPAKPKAIAKPPSKPKSTTEVRPADQMTAARHS